MAEREDGPDLLEELTRLTHEYAGLYRDALQQAAWSRSDLEDLRRTLAVVAHDMRSPLTVVAGAAELLLDDASLAPQHRDLVRRIEASAQALTTLAQDLVDAMGLKQAGLLLAPVDVVSMVEAVVARQRLVRGHADRIEVSIDVAPGPATQVLGDRARLERAIDNLLGNALKYSPQHEKVSVTVTTAAAQVEVLVADRGPGVPEEHQQSIFEAFTRAPNTAAAPGTGLGLAIVKEIADLHRGQVRLDSAEGAGARFTLVLPLLVAPHDRLDDPASLEEDRATSVA